LSEFDSNVNKSEFPISAYLSYPDLSNGWWLGFPTNKEDLQSALKILGAENGDVEVQYYTTGENELYNRLPNKLNADNLNELNFLALHLNEMSESELEIFEAVVEADWHCGSLLDIINIGENLDKFDLQPAYSAEQYGEFHRDLARDEYADIVSRLLNSKDVKDRDFASYIEDIEENLNLTFYGQLQSDREDGVFTEQGYLTRAGAFEEIYRSHHDLPDDFKVYENPQPLKLADTELAGFVVKAHSLCGGDSQSASYNLNVLANLRSAEYLMLMDGRNIFLTEAAHAYRRGTTAYDAFSNMNTQGNPNIKAFAIHVTDVHNGPARGDVVELNAEDRRQDILYHSIEHTRVDAVPKFGPEQSFSPEEWERLEDIDRHMLESWTRHFESNDLKAVNRHLDDLRDSDSDIGNIVDESAFLAKMNGSYMAAAENPQPDMLRITLPVAKEMLARGDAEVYRLFPEGPDKLQPLDAIRNSGSLWYQEYREFAIKRKDMPGLDRWAARETAALIKQRQKEHDAPDKPKNRNHEL